MTRFATRPIVMGMRGVVTAGHYLAAEAGLRIMHQGGNAIDASAAMWFCINFLEFLIDSEHLHPKNVR